MGRYGALVIQVVGDEEIAQMWRFIWAESQSFASDMISYVEGALTPIFDENYSGQKLIAVLGGQRKSMDDNAAKMFDDDLNTATQWNVVQIGRAHV